MLIFSIVVDYSTMCATKNHRPNVNELTLVVGVLVVYIGVEVLVIWQ